MDWLFALAFFLWFELLSLPLRLALARSPMPSAVRRVLSRIAGPLVLILPVWWLGHFVSISTAGALIAAFSVIALINLAVLAGRGESGLPRALGYAPAAALSFWKRWLPVLAFEALTLALFFGFVAFRRWVPEMTFEVSASAAEKFANAMLYNVALHAPTLPPDDYWFSGHPLTYYYFGHFHGAAVARSAAVWGLPAAFSLNLALARLTVATFEATWLLARSAGVRSGWAVVAGLAAAWGGNPSSVAVAWQQWRAGAAAGYPFNPAAYSFWDASRAIKNVVDEFPAFSAILGDFHAHHLALPWLIAWLAIGIAGRRWLLNAAPGSLANLALAAAWIALGVASIIANFWYLPIILAAAPLLILPRLRLSAPSLAWGAILLLALALCVKVSIALQRGAESVPLQPGNIDFPLLRSLPLRTVPPELRSAPLELIAMWGFPALLFPVAALLCLRRPRALLRPEFLSSNIIFPLLSAVFFIQGHRAVAAIMLCIWMLCLIPLNRRLRNLALCALAGLFMLEILYVPDRFVGDLARYNSYFKFSYALWPVLWVIAAQLGARCWSLPHPARRWPARVALLLCLAAASLYTPLAMWARADQARRGDLYPRRPTLDYAAFVANRPAYALEAPLLAAVRAHVPLNDRVIEAAVPTPYNYGGRIASLAGRPVPIGWDHHEQQWRGEPAFAPLAARRAEVEAFYTASTPETMRLAARDLGARWAVYGKLEEERYGPAALAVMRRAGRVVAATPEAAPRYFLFAFPEGR